MANASNRDEVFHAINIERDYQINKWTEEGTLAEPVHEIPGWLLIIEKELADAKKTWYLDPEQSKREILSIAGSAVAALEQLGVVYRW